MCFYRKRQNKNKYCNFCHIKTHNTIDCRNKNRKVNIIDIEDNVNNFCNMKINDNNFPIYTLQNLSKDLSEPITVDVSLNKKVYTLELASGTAISCIPFVMYQTCFKDIPLLKT